MQRLSLDELTTFIICSLVAILCGVIIGLERESKGKPAGLRTLVLICLGSTLYVQVSILLAQGRGDPARTAAQVVTGIGFLGAGAIMRQSDTGYVAGLTTAASIWVTAAVGMIVGSGHYLIAIFSVIIVVLALRLLRVLETALFYHNGTEPKRIFFESNLGKTKWAIMGLLEENMVRPDEYSFREEAGRRPCLELKYIHKNRNHRSFLARVATLPHVLEMT